MFCWIHSFNKLWWLHTKAVMQEHALLWEKVGLVLKVCLARAAGRGKGFFEGLSEGVLRRRFWKEPRRQKHSFQGWPWSWSSSFLTRLIWSISSGPTPRNYEFARVEGVLWQCLQGKSGSNPVESVRPRLHTTPLSQRRVTYGSLITLRILALESIMQGNFVSLYVGSFWSTVRRAFPRKFSVLILQPQFCQRIPAFHRRKLAKKSRRKSTKNRLRLATKLLEIG